MNHKIRAIEDLIWFIRQGEPITCGELAEEQMVPGKTAWRRLQQWTAAGVARRVPGSRPYLYEPTLKLEDV